MSALFDEDEIIPQTPPSPLTIHRGDYKGIAVDTRFIPSAALLTHVEGYSWTLSRYYSQVRDKSNNLEGQQVNRKASNQQYVAINMLDIKVQQPLNHGDQDQTDKTKKVTGSAIFPPNTVIPNEGDMFVADAGDGQEYVFQIMSTRQLSMFKQSTYEVEYELIDYATPERMYDFEMKTDKTVFYHKDFRYHGQNPLLESDEHYAVNAIQSLYFEITRRWWHEFFSREYATLLIPNQEAPIYDPYFARFVRGMFETTDAPEIQKLRLLNGYGDDHFVGLTTILNVIQQKDKTLLSYVQEDMGYCSTRLFIRDPMMEGIFHSGIPYTMYPNIPEDTTDTYYWQWKKTLSGETLRAGPSRLGRISMMLEDQNLLGLPYGDTPLIHEIAGSKTYIFSDKFYSQAEQGQSKIELAVRDYINNKAIDPRLLVAFCKTSHAWGALERFYFTPIVLMLCNSWIRRL